MSFRTWFYVGQLTVLPRCPKRSSVRNLKNRRRMLYFKYFSNRVLSISRSKALRKMKISEKSRKRISLFADTNTPSITFLCFRSEVSIVVHRKRAKEMFSKYSMGTKPNSGFRRQSMLLISYSLVSRKYHRKQLRNEKFKVKLHFTMPPLRRHEMLIWSVYMCKLLRGGSIVKVKVTTALFPLFPIAERKIQYS